MRVAAYVHLNRTLLSRKPTGVGKHINNMVPGLAAEPDIDLTVVGAAEELSDGVIPADSPLHGMKVIGLPWRRKYLEASWSLVKRPRIERYAPGLDWVYCPAEAFVATKSARLAVTIHCVNWFEPELPWYDHADIRRERRSMAARFRRFRDSTHLLLPVSQFLAGRLTALFQIEPRRMRIVGNGVEEAYFNAGPLDDHRRTRIGGRPYLLVVGGLTRRKGGDCVLAVARELLARKSDLRILVAGTGEPHFDAPAAALSNVEHLGYVGVENGLPALLRASVGLLFPSRYETFGIPAAEALAAGTPAIVSHFAALPEVVGPAGVVVDPEKPAAIADISLNLARDTGLREKYVAAGRERARQHRWEACIARVAAALREV